MAIKEWSTNYSGANPVQDADPVTGSMPDLDEETALNAGDGDEMRSSQPEAVRDKLHAACKLIGDSANAPAGSLTEILDRDHINGDALQVRLGERASAPIAVADKVFLYAKDDGGVAKAYVEWGDGTEVEVGEGGGQTNTVSGANGITNTGDNIDATLAPTYGSSVDTVCQGNDSRLSDSRAPTGSASGDLGGTYPDPSVAAVTTTTGPTSMVVGAVADGEYLKRSGSTLVGDTPAGGGSSPLTTKGDVYTYDTGDARLAVGTDGQVLSADSAEATGLKWVTLAEGGGGGGGGTVENHPFFAAGAGASLLPSVVGGNYTLGVDFYAPRTGCSIAGAWFYTANAAPHTIRIRLWKNSTSIKLVDVACDGAGLYEGRFATPYDLPDNELHTPFRMSMWETSGTVHTNWSSTPYGAQDYFFDHYILRGAYPNKYVAGEGEPVSNGAGCHPIDPIVTLPSASGGGFEAYVEEFTASAGANEFTLSATPAVNANTLSGRNILGVFRNGVRSRYQATATLANEYDQTGGNDKINVAAQTGGEIFTVVFGV